MSETYSGNRYLKQTEMTANARYITDYLLARGWSINAICGMLGNMQTESGINPGIWQNLDEGNTSLGFGLVQWTPATKYLNWCYERDLEPGAMDSNLERILWEVENSQQWIATSDYPMSFVEFTTSEESVDTLAAAFLYNYERAGAPKLWKRQEQARTWYSILSGLEPTTPSKDKSKMSLILLLLAAQRK